MYIVYPTELQKPAFIKHANTVFPALTQLGIRVPCPVNADSGYRAGMLAGVSVDLTGQLAGMELAHCAVGEMHSNCGICTIGHLWIRPPHLELGKLFLKYVESYLSACRYGFLLGSDGSSSGYRSRTFIQTYGEGWTIEEWGDNQRMKRQSPSSHALCGFKKTLNWDEAMKVDWHNAKQC